MPSNREFGSFFFILFTCFSCYAFYKSWILVFAGASVLAILFASALLLAPRFLTPLNRVWFQFGLRIGRIFSPVVLSAIFFALITPTALLCRALGRDELRLKKQSTSSYWIDRLPPGPAPTSFKKQF